MHAFAPAMKACEAAGTTFFGGKFVNVNFYTADGHLVANCNFG